MTDNPLEKLFTWSPEKIGWYADACEYSGNNRNQKLAEAILESLPPSPQIGDIGCGIGGLSINLAKKASKITAVDLNGDALDYFRKIIARDSIHNIEILEGDFKTLAPSALNVDCVVFCMVGDIDFINRAMSWTDNKIVLIIDNAESRSFASKPRKHTRLSPDSVRSSLLEAGLKFEEKSIAASFGQPFSSFDEAIKFFSCYDRDSSKDEIKKSLDTRLVKTGMADFPFFLPNDKEYLMFVATN